MGHKLDTFLLFIVGIVLFGKVSKEGALDGVRVVEELGGRGLLRYIWTQHAQSILHLLNGADEVMIHSLDSLDSL